MSLLGTIFDPSGLTPHGFCLTWAPGLIWLHAGSDALTTLAYVSIPVSLFWLLWRRRDRTYRWIGYLFVVFILACATTHGLAILTLWVPAYGLEGLAKAFTAVMSITTAATLWIAAPRLAAMLSPVELTNLNTNLAKTVIKQEATVRELRDREATLRGSISQLEVKLAGHVAQARASEAQLVEVAAEQVVTQALLAKSEAEYHASFETATVGKVQVEPLSGHLLRVNAAFAGMLGYQPNDLVGREVWDLVYPDDRAAARARFSQLLAREIVNWVMEKRLVRRDGVALWVRMSATVVLDPSLGLPRLALLEVEDLDMRRDIQAALRATEARLRLALETAQIGVWEFDIRNGLCWTDHRSSRVTGGAVPAETWVALSSAPYAAWVKRIHPDDRDRRERQLQTVFSGSANAVQIEYRALGPGGEWLHLSNKCAVVERDPATGVPIRAVGVVADVTERVAALNAALEAKANCERAMQAQKAALSHRHLLLREVYHRMDDNLRIVVDLLTAKTVHIADRETLASLSLQRSRIFALGSAHRMLMTPMDIETVDMVPFLRGVWTAVLANGGNPNATLQMDGRHRKLTLDYVVLMGLLMTELLANYLNYASLDGQGRIVVTSAGSEGAGMALFMTCDETTPVSSQQSEAFTAALETALVMDLVYELGAELRISANHGLRVELMIAGPT